MNYNVKLDCRLQIVCSVLRNAVVAIFGPKDSIDSMQVQSICEAFEVPLIEMRPDFESYRADQSINLFPRPSLLVNAYIDLVREWGWKSFAIVYEENSGLNDISKQRWPSGTFDRQFGGLDHRFCHFCRTSY